MNLTLIQNQKPSIPVPTDVFPRINPRDEALPSFLSQKRSEKFPLPDSPFHRLITINVKYLLTYEDTPTRSLLSEIWRKILGPSHSEDIEITTLEAFVCYYIFDPKYHDAIEPLVNANKGSKAQFKQVIRNIYKKNEWMYDDYACYCDIILNSRSFNRELFLLKYGGFMPVQDLESTQASSQEADCKRKLEQLEISEKNYNGFLEHNPKFRLTLQQILKELKEANLVLPKEELNGKQKLTAICYAIKKIDSYKHDKSSNPIEAAQRSIDAFFNEINDKEFCKKIVFDFNKKFPDVVKFLVKSQTCKQIFETLESYINPKKEVQIGEELKKKVRSSQMLIE